MEDTDKAKI
jgi:DNA polymerase kappa